MPECAFCLDDSQVEKDKIFVIHGNGCICESCAHRCVLRVREEKAIMAGEYGANGSVSDSE